MFLRKCVPKKVVPTIPENVDAIVYATTICTLRRPDLDRVDHASVKCCPT